MRMRTMLGNLVGLMVVSACLGGTVSAADDQTEGRKHSRRAAQLAGANKCKAAIVEYSKALELLKDPVLLFNRAECYRRINDGERALADYRRFLSEMPLAPNRPQVEARIAALDPAAPAPAAPASVGAKPSPGAPAETSAQASKPAPPGPQPGTPIPPLTMESVPGGGSGSASPSPTNGEPQIVLVDRDPSPAPGDESGGSITGRWWFWTTLAAVVIGGGVAAYFVVNAGKTEIPPSRLGNYTF